MTGIARQRRVRLRRKPDASPYLMEMRGIEPLTSCLLATLIGESVKNFSARGDDRDRTGDLLLAKQALYQLSYVPCESAGAFWRTKQALYQLSYIPQSMVGPSGFEPETSALSAQRSNQLSYEPLESSMMRPSTFRVRK